MIKNLGLGLLASAVVAGGVTLSAINSKNENVKDTSLTTSKFSQLSDGRNGNGIGAGTILNVGITAGPYYVGQEITISEGEVKIPGRPKSIEWTVNYKGVDYPLGTFKLEEAGLQEFSVTATTYFENGQKDGLIHSTTAPFAVTINVQPQSEVVDGTPEGDKVPETVVYEQDKVANSGKGNVDILSIDLDESYQYVANDSDGVANDLNAKAKFIFSDGNVIDVQKTFTDVDPEGTVDFSTIYKGKTYEWKYKAPKQR